MPASAPNPYASPSTTEVDLPSAGFDGRMPWSVRLSIGCLAVLTLFLGVGLAGCLSQGASQAEVLTTLTPFAIGVALLIGLLLRHPAARRVARVAVLIGALLATWTLVSVAAMISRSSQGNAGPVAVFINGEPVPAASVVWVQTLMLAWVTLMTLCLWIPFFALGRRSARQYFDPEKRMGDVRLATPAGEESHGNGG